VSALKLVTASTQEPVTRDEMKTWLRADEHEIAEDGLIDSLITRARSRIEELANRSFLVQTFDYYLDEMPNDGCPIALPKAPLASVVSIKGFQSTELTDTGGTAMSSSGYYVDTAHEFGRVMPLQAFTYPTATREINAAIIRFTAGYSTGSSGVPESAKTEIKQLVARLYEHRGDEVELAKALLEYDPMPSELDLPSWG
jgi:uncharacterized phiE125 gp8 family phage protein